MPDALTVALIGQYETPRYDYGDEVTDAIRGPVVIVKTSAAPLPWPMGKNPNSRKPGLVIFTGLENALRTESAAAICHWWGITGQTITKWRRLLGIDSVTPGSTQLRRKRLIPRLDSMRAMIDYAAPERGQKIAAARRGKPRPAHVQTILREARAKQVASPEIRKRCSDTMKRRGIRPPKAGRPWTPEEDHAVRTLVAAEVMKITGRTLQAVYSRRHQLRLPDGRHTRPAAESFSTTGQRPGSTTSGNHS